VSAALLELPRHTALRVAEFPGKGRGLVAGADIREDDLLEVAPVLPMRKDELGSRTDGIYSYPFDWPDPPYIEAFALGMISLLNHSEDPNAWFETDIPNRVIRLYALRDIRAGEEITINYGIPLWFEFHP
jgi:hypothetical protein